MPNPNGHQCTTPRFERAARNAGMWPGRAAHHAGVLGSPQGLSAGVPVAACCAINFDYGRLGKATRRCCACT